MSHTTSDPCHRNIPTLYKYRPLGKPDKNGKCKERDFVEDILFERRLYICPANELNDPFECRGDSSQTFDPRDARTRELLEAYARENAPRCYTREAVCQAHNSYLESLKRGGLDELETESLGRLGIVSFATCPKNIRMWSHYTDSHRGIAIEFSPSCERHKHFCDYLLDVEYEKERPSVNYLDDPSRLVAPLTRAVRTKSREWKYEHEWRLVVWFDTPQRYIKQIGAYWFFEYPRELVTAIYLGCEISPEDGLFIRNSLREHDYDIPVHQLKRSPSKYALEDA